MGADMGFPERTVENGRRKVGGVVCGPTCRAEKCQMLECWNNAVGYWRQSISFWKKHRECDDMSFETFQHSNIPAFGIFPLTDATSIRGKIVIRDYFVGGSGFAWARIWSNQL
jgi:hypothetical protein